MVAWLGAAMPAIIQGVSQLTSTGMSNSASSANSLEANQRNQINYRHRYQWTAEDMRKAGLNPILAASSGFDVGQAPNAPQAQVIPYSSTDAATAYNQYSQAKKAEQESKLISEQTRHEIEKKQLTVNQVKTELEKAGMFKTQAQNNYRQFLKAAEELKNLKANRASIEANTEQINVLTAQARESLEKLKSIGDVYETPYWGQFLAGLGEISKALGLLPVAATKPFLIKK